jgi:hypothetical protein
MPTADLAKAASQLLKVELLIARIQLRIQARRALLVYFALSLALFGVIMLNVAAYQWLKLQYGPVTAPLGIALADLLLAVLAAALAWGARAGPELEVAQDMRKMLLAELDGAVKKNAAPLFAPSLLDFRSAQAVIPIAIALVRMLRRRRKTTTSP